VECMYDRSTCCCEEAWQPRCPPVPFAAHPAQGRGGSSNPCGPVAAPDGPPLAAAFSPLARPHISTSQALANTHLMALQESAAPATSREGIPIIECSIPRQLCKGQVTWHCEHTATPALIHSADGWCRRDRKPQGHRANQRAPGAFARIFSYRERVGSIPCARVVSPLVGGEVTKLTRAWACNR
jgi:hypothetical protein